MIIFFIGPVYLHFQYTPLCNENTFNQKHVLSNNLSIQNIDSGSELIVDNKRLNKKTATSGSRKR